MKLKLSIITLIFIFLIPSIVFAANSRVDKLGYIFLQVEKNGEAWYIYPGDSHRYYLGRPDDAYSIMKKLALGATHSYISETEIFPDRLSGMILLDTEKNGEAYYIYPKNKQKYYLGRPADAFRIMSNLGLGILNKDLNDFSLPGSLSSLASFSSQSSADAKLILQNVPFTSQAPSGDWKDLRQEDACEEATSLMAVKWARGETLTKDLALKEILGASDYILKKYQEFRDVSTVDTLNWIIKDYFNDQLSAVYNNITLEDIIMELKKGNLVITPMNGQLLKNPNFTQPGPINHMVLIRGYDPVTKELITNDPGTRKGELYRYQAESLYKAIRDYPTGNHKAIPKLERSMIVVSK
jgi:hypothetical protein